MKTSHMIIYCNISNFVAILLTDISRLGFQFSFVGFRWVVGETSVFFSNYVSQVPPQRVVFTAVYSFDQILMVESLAIYKTRRFQMMDYSDLDIGSWSDFVRFQLFLFSWVGSSAPLIQCDVLVGGSRWQARALITRSWRCCDASITSPTYRLMWWGRHVTSHLKRSLLSQHMD